MYVFTNTSLMKEKETHQTMEGFSDLKYFILWFLNNLK